MNNWCICWFLRIFLLGILMLKLLTARRLYKAFGVKELNHVGRKHERSYCYIGNAVIVRQLLLLNC
jgi:hypothetical protein